MQIVTKICYLQDNGLVPIVEPEILLDRYHGIDRTFEVAQKVWAEVFFNLAENNVMFEGILLKPSMVTPGAECKEKATPSRSLSTLSSSFAGEFLRPCLGSWQVLFSFHQYKNYIQSFISSGLLKHSPFRNQFLSGGSIRG